MKIVRHSSFKNSESDIQSFYNWVNRLQNHTGRVYQKLELTTALGKTLVWRTGKPDSTLKLVIFPGFRTTPLFWDLDKGLDFYVNDFDVYLVETNGQPNPSDGNSPAIKGLGYGEWASELLDKLQLEKPIIAGASFGGQICMKLSMFSPDRFKAAFLLNPGGIQPISLSWKNIYSNLLPLLIPSKKNIATFLDNAVFHKPYHYLDPIPYSLLLDFEHLAITRYRDKTQKPYFMKGEFEKIKSPMYLIEGEKDLLFPAHKSVENAKKFIGTLRDSIIFPNVGHGIETYRPVHEEVAEIIKKLALKGS
jgi:pimeloyl-ACP methyl ester carboxylesterase